VEYDYEEGRTIEINGYQLILKSVDIYVLRRQGLIKYREIGD
jgi:hypothetical protein